MTQMENAKKKKKKTTTKYYIFYDCKFVKTFAHGKRTEGNSLM